MTRRSRSAGPLRLGGVAFAASQPFSRARRKTTVFRKSLAGRVGDCAIPHHPPLAILVQHRGRASPGFWIGCSQWQRVKKANITSESKPTTISPATIWWSRLVGTAMCVDAGRYDPSRDLPRKAERLHWWLHWAGHGQRIRKEEGPQKRLGSPPFRTPSW